VDPKVVHEFDAQSLRTAPHRDTSRRGQDADRDDKRDARHFF